MLLLLLACAGPPVATEAVATREVATRDVATTPATAPPVATPWPLPPTPAPVPVVAPTVPKPAPSPASFAAVARPLTPTEQSAMVGVSWHEGCPVPLDGLRRLNVTFHRPDGTAATGALVVRAEAVDALSTALRGLWDAGYPIERMEPIERFHGDDDASMAANNTSAFNCRTIAHSAKLSQHAYGLAVDVNPLWNPWVRGGEGATRVAPPTGAPWADRSRTDPGVLHGGDAAVSAFSAVGWRWGGAWQSTKDYQHFSRSGG